MDNVQPLSLFQCLLDVVQSYYLCLCICWEVYNQVNIVCIPDWCTNPFTLLVWLLDVVQPCTVLPRSNISEARYGISPYDFIFNNNIALRDLISRLWLWVRSFATKVLNVRGTVLVDVLLILLVSRTTNITMTLFATISTYYILPPSGKKSGDTADRVIANLPYNGAWLYNNFNLSDSR